MLARILLLLLVACRLGRPPTQVGGVEIVRVLVPAAQPGLERSLYRALAESLTQRGVGSGSVPVEVEVLDASTRVIAVDGSVRIIGARLEMAVMMRGPRPRDVRLVGEYAYSVSREDWESGTRERAEAFEIIGERLAQDAADWILYGAAPL